MESENLKDVIKQRYGKIAEQNKPTENNFACGCSGNSCCSTEEYSDFSDDYSNLEGYVADADMGLGCGLPTQFAGILPGHHVLDLGSGAGNDCFVARAIVGKSGLVTGLDFTDAMLIKARENAEKLGYTNVQFVKGDIEEMPFENDTFDVIVSNCVLNLVPDKHKAFSEMMRVLKPGGHFCVSDVVVRGELPQSVIRDAELYAGCIAGAMEWEAYLQLVLDHGFTDMKVHTSKQITLPNEFLATYLNEQEVEEYKSNKAGLFSITVTGYKK
ncbi:MAG TPA: arsenite methyltransferase [Lentimicrobium sp.]|nr:arsenite methyltransferase [Lentimicrobium sp.]